MWLKGCLFFRVTPLIMREMKIWIFKLFFPTFFYTFSQKCFYFPLQTDFSSTSANKTIKNAVHRSNIPNFRGIQNKGLSMFWIKFSKICLLRILGKTKIKCDKKNFLWMNFFSFVFQNFIKNCMRSHNSSNVLFNNIYCRFLIFCGLFVAYIIYT